MDDLAKGNRSKWEYYLNMNVVEFFNELAFRKDKKKELNDMISKLIKGKTTEESTMLLLAYLAQKM